MKWRRGEKQNRVCPWARSPGTESCNKPWNLPTLGPSVEDTEERKAKVSASSRSARLSETDRPPLPTRHTRSSCEREDAAMCRVLGERTRQGARFHL